MQLERAKFADNGNCGYVLKPPYLRSRQPTAPDTAAAADTPDAVSAAAAGAPPPPPPPPAAAARRRRRPRSDRLGRSDLALASGKAHTTP